MMELCINRHPTNLGHCSALQRADCQTSNWFQSTELRYGVGGDDDSATRKKLPAPIARFKERGIFTFEIYKSCLSTSLCPETRFVEFHYSLCLNEPSLRLSGNIEPNW